MLTFYFSGADGHMTEPEVLTTGMVGKAVKLEFSAEWDGLVKTAVFSDGTLVRDVACAGDTVVIPAEVLTRPLRPFSVGVYGVNSDGTVVIPTIRAVGPKILPGVDPSGDAGTDPTPPIWAQLQALMGDLGDLNTESSDSLVNAINELVEEKADNGLISVYEYAVRGGYTGTEAELMQKLATESVRTVNGMAPDVSGDVALAMPSDMVLYAEQALTEEQQNTARANIDAASTAAVTTAQETANTASGSASSAMSRANLAYNLANQAKTAATTAQTTANGKLSASGITKQTILATKTDGSTMTLTVLVAT